MGAFKEMMIEEDERVAQQEQNELLGQDMDSVDAEAVALLKVASLGIADIAAQLQEGRLTLISSNGALVDAVDHIIRCLKNDSDLLGRLSDIQAEASPHFKRAL